MTDLANAFRLHLGTINRGAYPPTFILWLEPLTLLGPALAFWLWILLNAALVTILLACLSRRIAATDKWAAYSFAALSILYPPLHEHFRYAQSQIVMSVLLAAMYSAKDEIAEISLALATLLRVFPVVMIGYFLTGKRWRAFLHFALGIGVGGFLTVGIFGFDRTVSFDRVLPFLLNSEWFQSPYNVSIEGIATSLCVLLMPQRLLILYGFALHAAALFLRFAIFGVTYLLMSSHAPDPLKALLRQRGSWRWQSAGTSRAY